MTISEKLMKIAEIKEDIRKAINEQGVQLDPSEYFDVYPDRVRAIEKRSSFNVYTTEEQVIGRWIDGKPLYRRTFEVVSPSVTSSWVSVVPEIPDVHAVKIYGTLAIVPNSILPLPYVGDSMALVAYAESGVSFFGATGIVMNVMQTSVSKPATLILEYTKTTDTGGTYDKN